MKRIEAIKEIMNTVDENTIVVSSCGMISREVYCVKDRPLNFYVMGSMGAALSIGIGIALCKPSKKVIVIAGDGETLMELGTLVLLKKLQEKYVVRGLEMAMPYIREGDSQKANNIIIENKFNLDLYILDNNQYQSTGGQKTVSDCIDFRSLCDCKVIFINSEINKIDRIPLTPVEIKERFMEAVK